MKLEQCEASDKIPGVSREFPKPLILKVFGSFGMAACRKWNRNLRNVGASRTDRGYRAI
jgi:hypothetical protein